MFIKMLHNRKTAQGMIMYTHEYFLTGSLHRKNHQFNPWTYALPALKKRRQTVFFFSEKK